MNRDIVRSRWAEISWEIRQRWAKLREDELIEVNGDPDRFIDLLEREYGWSKRTATEKYSDFMARYLNERDEDIPRA